MEGMLSGIHSGISILYLALISPDILNNWVLTQLELFDKTGWTNNGPTGWNIQALWK